MKTILALDSDIVCLTELDCYHDFFKHRLGNAVGYDSRWHKRPRSSSHDGCGIFWRTSKFCFEAEEFIDFVDSVEGTRSPSEGQRGLRERKDRCALAVLLRSRRSSNRIIVLSTHLARNPEDAKKDTLRVRQLAQLFRMLSMFSHKYNALGEPVVLAGDMNTTHFADLRGLMASTAVLHSWWLQQQIQKTQDSAGTSPSSDRWDLHPFMWDMEEAPSPATSVTEARNVRIDTIAYQDSRLALVDVNVVPNLAGPIPDAEHPSDHLPIRAKFQVRTQLSCLEAFARNWLNTICAALSATDESLGVWSDGYGELQPLSKETLRSAFMFFDSRGDGTISPLKFVRTMRRLGVTSRDEVRFTKSVLNMCSGGGPQPASYSLGEESLGLDLPTESWEGLDLDLAEAALELPQTSDPRNTRPLNESGLEPPKNYAPASPKNQRTSPGSGKPRSRRLSRQITVDSLTEPVPITFTGFCSAYVRALHVRAAHRTPALGAAFRAFDPHGDGYITNQAFHSVFESCLPGLPAELKVCPSTPK